MIKGCESCLGRCAIVNRREALDNKKIHKMGMANFQTEGQSSEMSTFSEQRVGDSRTLRGGVAKSDITINDPEITVNDPLYAKALVLDDGKTRLAIITMDAVAIGGICEIPDSFLLRLRKRIEEELHIPGRHVLVNASHTHPPEPILCDEDEQVARTFDAVRRAVDGMTEVTIGSGTGKEDRISMNRNLRMKDGSHWTIRHSNPSPPDDDVVGLGPVDPEIGILRVDRADRVDGPPLAVVYNFACHFLFGDPTGKVTANIPGVASRVLEDYWAGQTMAFFVQGACGDIIDVGFKDFMVPREVETLGQKLGQSTLKAVRAISTATSTLEVLSQTVLFPRRTDSAECIRAKEKERDELVESLRFMTLNFELFQSLHPHGTGGSISPLAAPYHYLRDTDRMRSDYRSMDELNRTNVARYLENIRTMERLARIQDEIATYQRHQAINAESGESTIAAEIQVLRIAECVIIGAPLEVLTEVSLNVKKASPFAQTFLAAFSNGYMHYGPPVGDYAKGGYEVIECFLAPEWQEVFEQTVGELLSRLEGPKN